MVSETKIDDTFHKSQFVIESCSKPFRLDHRSKGGGIVVYIKENLSSRYIK